MEREEAMKIGEDILYNGKFKKYGGYYLEFEKDGLTLRLETSPTEEGFYWIIIDSNGNWLYNPL